MEVGGVCGNDGSLKAKSEANLNCEEICGLGRFCEASVERHLASSGGGDDVASDLGTKGIGVSVGEASSNDRLEMEVEGPVAEQSVEKNKKMVGGEDDCDVADEIPLRKVEAVNDEVQNVEIGTGLEESKATMNSTGGKTQVAHMEETVGGAGKEDLERGLLGDNVERGTGMVGSVGSEAQGKGAENGVESSTVLSGTLEREAQVVEEIAMEKKNSLEKELHKNAKQGSELNSAGDDADQVVETQKLGGLDDEIWNPGIETIDAGCLAIGEESSAPPQVVEEDVSMVSEEVLDSKKDTPSNLAVEGISSSSGEKKIPLAEIDDEGTEKDAIINAIPNSLDEQIPVVLVGEVSSDQGGYMCTTIEGMDTDTFDENLSFSLEELQGHVETANGSTEKQCNVCADSTSSFQPTQVVVGEDVAMAEKVHPDFEEPQQLKLEENLCQGTALVGSNVEQVNEIEKEVSNAKLDGLLSSSVSVQNNRDETLCMGTELDTQDSGGDNKISPMDNKEVLNDAKPDISDERKEILSQKHLTKVLMDGDSSENHRNACSDSISTLQAALEAVSGESMTVDDVPKYVNVEVLHPCSSEFDVTLSCSGNEQSFNAEVVCASTEMCNQVMNGGEIVLKYSKQLLDSNVGGLEPAYLYEVDLTVGQEMQVEEQVIDAEQVDLHEPEEMEVEEPDSEHGHTHGAEEKFIKWTTVKAGNLVKSHQASYQLSLEDKGEFDVFDLVWGKVRSHPWWPGQIFDPSDASEKAMKYHKKDCFLVAYFGDRTFAWVDASQLKPFYSHFSQVEKQSNAEVFQNAVSCALEEVSRRVELELACSCIPKDAYDEIRFQIVENTGIRQESSMRDGVDEFASVQSFQPDKLVEYMRALAQSPVSGADRLELVVAKAQLLSFYRLKGYYRLPEFQFCGGLVENSVDAFDFDDKMHATPFSKDDEHVHSAQEIPGTQRSSYHKRKHNLKNSMYPRKERSLSELMSGSLDSLDDDEFGTSRLVSPSSGKRRKVVDSTGDDSLQDVRKTISLAKVSATTSQMPKPSFKIGECIRRVASQMAGSPSILKSNSERLQKFDGDGADISFENFEDLEGKKMILPADYTSLDDLLSQLHLTARDPMKGYSFLNTIICFFSDFRNTIIFSRPVDKAGGKRKRSSHSIFGSPETFEFEDMSDTYWTDRVIQNGSEEQPSGRNGGGYKIVPVELEKPAQKSRRSYSRKQYADGNQDLAPPKPPGYVDENSPAELILNFPEVNCIPSETNLNKIFRRFGPLKESETEIDEETNRARVVFKKCSDAEVASSSAAKFNIFGSMAVNYQISYIISLPFKTSPIATTLGEGYAT
ncbi:uncharacterized protein LOC123227457 isoform X2 [Mangifera indica]|nr:uncharacterized protein LOC123227457 isoform X2 [Mangifera indica]